METGGDFSLLTQEELVALRTRLFDAESALITLVRLRVPLAAGDEELAWSRARAVIEQIPADVREEYGALADEEEALRAYRAALRPKMT